MTRHEAAPLLLVAGALSASLFIVGLALDLPSLRLAVKTLPVLAMAAWVFPAGDRRVAWGLAFGALGDFLLALPSAFLAGMAAFAVGHALYVRAFFAWERMARIALALPVVLYLTAILALMWPGLGDMAIPVAVYMTIIGLMIWRAAAVAQSADAAAGAARWAALAGALLFAFSDTLIGVNRFAAPLPGAGYPIILAYWAGQFLIAYAALARR